MLKSARRFALAAAAGLGMAACSPGERAAQSVASSEQKAHVFAAASLIDVLKTIGDDYAALGHPAPVINFAATSELARQIEQGADADVFISADEAWMDYLVERDLIDPATRATLLNNALVLVAPCDRPLMIEIKDGMDLKAALKGGKLAIANPDSVPAGKYARQALEHFGVWASVENETARTENVRAALRFVETGEAAAGIVYATDAKGAGGRVVVVGEFPAGSHTPIAYPAALISGKNGGPGGDFLDYLSSPEARLTFEAAGFGVR